MSTRWGIAVFVLLSLATGATASAIINGSLDTGHSAVGVVTDGSGMMSSAVLVDPHWVLTSATFASAVSGGSFLVGLDYAAPAAVYSFSGIYPHPSYDPNTGANDIALIRLSPVVAGVQPIPCLAAPLDIYLGTAIQYVGYGAISPYDFSNTTRHSCPSAVGTLSARQFETQYSGAGPYYGDGGGPALVTIGGTEYVAGIISLVEQDGTGYTISTRVTAYASFIQNTMASNPPTTGVASDPPAARLLGVAPNPFNPRTTIRFDLPAAGQAQLSIYDLAGRLVRVLVEGEIPAGSHEAVWDGKDTTGRSAPSGSYLARLGAGGKVEGVRLSLVR